MTMNLRDQLRAYSDHIVERVDVEEVRDRPVTVGPKPPARRGWMVAVAAAGVVLVLGIALTVWGPLGGTAPVTEATSTTIGETAPEGLPPVDTWSWQRVDGDSETLPQSLVELIDGGFVAPEPASCLGTGPEPVCDEPPEFWWRSQDGVTWRQEPLDPSLIGAPLAPGSSAERVWVIADRTASGEPPHLYWLVDGEVRAFALDGPIESLEPPAIRADVVVVPGATTSGPALWVSQDAGSSFARTDAPWTSGTLATLLGAPQGFVAYVDVGSPGAVLLEAWTSLDGHAWDQVGPVAFAGEPIGWFEVYGDRGPYFASTVDTAGEVGAFWFSEDGVTWSRPVGLPPVTDPGAESFFATDFGFVFITFVYGPDYTGNDLVRVLVSADGLSWEDVSDPTIMMPSDFPEGATSAHLAWSAAGGRVFIARSYDSGQRTLWVGGFED